MSASLLEAQRPRKQSRSASPATFYAVVSGNDTYWRVRAPAKVLGAKVVLIPDEQAEDVLGFPNKGEVFPWSLHMRLVDGQVKGIHTRGAWERMKVHNPPYRFHELSASFPEHEGVAVFTRPMFYQAVLAQSMRKLGIRTIAENDDNYFASAEQTLFLRQAGYDENTRSTHAKAFAQQSACIFSTEWLLARYWKEFRARFGKQGMPEMFLCRNHVPLADWPERIERDGPLRVGFMGSTSHVWDINIAFAAFKAAHELGAKTTMIGYNPADPDPGLPEIVIDEQGKTHGFQRSERSQENIERWSEVVDEHIPWIDSEEYHRGALPLDIGLCPLLSNDFGMGKSDVKAIEYTISGAAVVCTNTPVYNHFWKDGETCLMGTSYRELAEATVRLIRDPKLRYELVSAAQEKVASERGDEQMRSEWTAALSGA